MMFLLMLACNGPVGDAAFKGGEYEVATVGMVDDCLDGALEALFMPQGRETPQVFEFPVYVPGTDELPMTYDISLREPFVGVEMTVDAADEGLSGSSDVIEEVLLNEPLYGDCVSSLQAEVTLLPETATTGTGSAQLTMSAFRGEEDRCPEEELQSDPCLVSLELTLQRL